MFKGRIETNENRMVRSDAVVVAMPIREGFSDEVANAKERL
jgi:hypothetical protein